MTKPMEVSFKGLGEPMRQIRELIKDLWYRNRQEEHRGDMELLRQQRSLEAELGQALVRPTAKNPEPVDRDPAPLPNRESIRSLAAPTGPSPTAPKRKTQRRWP